MAEFTLYIGDKNISSWSLRAWLAIKQTKCDFKEIHIPLDKPDTHEKILRHSPSGKVPALCHGELMVWDSLAICEYLAECFPEAQLWPKDKTARAIARAVSAEMHSGFPALRQQLPMNINADISQHTIKAEAENDIKRIITIWENYIEKFGSKSGYLFGNFCIADIMFTPVVTRFNTYHVPLTKVASHYAKLIMSRQDVKQWYSAAV